jgi:hypothetical protein
MKREGRKCSRLRAGSSPSIPGAISLGRPGDAVAATRFRGGLLPRLALTTALTIGALLADKPARADNVTDTVLLTNGGRVRGTVMEEDPQKGTSIKLVDGTFQRLKPAEVKQVLYGGRVDPAPSPQIPTPLLAAPGPLTPPSAPIPPGVLPALDPHQVAEDAVANPGRGKAMRGAGIALTVAGGVTVILGSIALGALAGADCVSGCAYTYALPAALLAGGGSLLVPGLVLWSVGQGRVSEARRATVSLSLEGTSGAVGARGGSLALRF